MYRVYRALVCLCLCLMLLACDKTIETNVEWGNREKVLFIANGEEPRELDPLLVKGGAESSIVSGLFEGLVNLHPENLSIEPGVAKSWTISDDLLSYTFNLRRDARWSNGDKVTAHDFVYAWRRSLLPNFSSDWAYMKSFVKNARLYNEGKLSNFNEVGVQAIDDVTLRVELEHPTPFFLQLVAHYSYFPLHKKTIEAFGPIDRAFTKWTRAENMVNNGPFVLEEWRIYQKIVLKKNPLYWDAENIALNGLHFLPIDNQQAEVRAFRSGQVHLTYTPTMAVEKMAYFQKNYPERIRQVQTYAGYHYFFNTTKPPFDDVRVRKALAMSINRELIVDKVAKAGQRPSYAFVPPDPEGYRAKFHFSYDPEYARSLLAEAGYANGEGFPEVNILYNSQDDHRNIALAIQQMWKENLNIQVGTNNQEWKVFLNSRRQLDFDIARAGWIADYLDPSNFFEILMSNSGNNNSGWVNGDYDALMEQIKETSNIEERFVLFERANKILADEMPVMPIYYNSDTNLVLENVDGWFDNVMHHHPYNRVSLK